MKIKSFLKDHTTLKPGIYLQETKNNVDIYDLRFVEPNIKAIPIKAMHTIEHLFATYLKTISPLKNEVISFCPGACQTMFYLEVFNDRYIDISDVKEELINCIDWCLSQNTIPGATEKECGNYKSHNLLEAQVWLLIYKGCING